MIEVLDRVAAQPGRYKITMPDGSSQYVTIERADEPTRNGTPINKALFDSIAADIGDLSALKTTEKGSLVGAVNEQYGTITNLDVDANSMTSLADICDFLEANPLKVLSGSIGHLETSSIKSVLEIPRDISSSNYVAVRISRVGINAYLAVAINRLAEECLDCYIYKNNNGYYKTSWTKR